MPNFYLVEAAAGFALFKKKDLEEVGLKDTEVQKAMKDFSKFSRQVTLEAWRPFESATETLEALNAVSEGVCPSSLANFLEANMKKKSGTLGVRCVKLCAAIKEHLGIQCEYNSNVDEAMRLLSGYLTKFVDGLDQSTLHRHQVGAGTNYSRGKLLFNVNRSSQAIVQSSAVVEALDKYINQSAMRVREWYSYHFPELGKLIPDHLTYARAVHYLGRRDQRERWTVKGLVDACAEAGTDDVNEEVAQKVLDLAPLSAGIDLAELDESMLEALTKRMIELATLRDDTKRYLEDKVQVTCPATGAVCGTNVAAKLLSHCGSITNLAKMPGSTIQILGSEKSLFQAIKKRQPTPKFGHLYHCSLIGKASRQHKGKMARAVATKAALAARIDAFSDAPNPLWGKALRRLAEDRLTQLETGGQFTPNDEAMEAAFEAVQKEAELEGGEAAKPSRSSRKEKESSAKKRGRGDDSDSEDEGRGRSSSAKRGRERSASKSRKTETREKSVSRGRERSASKSRKEEPKKERESSRSRGESKDRRSKDREGSSKRERSASKDDKSRERSKSKSRDEKESKSRSDDKRKSSRRDKDDDDRRKSSRRDSDGDRRRSSRHEEPSAKRSRH